MFLKLQPEELIFNQLNLGANWDYILGNTDRSWHSQALKPTKKWLFKQSQRFDRWLRARANLNKVHFLHGSLFQDWERTAHSTRARWGACIKQWKSVGILSAWKRSKLPRNPGVPLKGQHSGSCFGHSPRALMGERQHRAYEIYKEENWVARPWREIWRVNYWDPGPEPIFHTTHRCHLPKVWHSFSYSTSL